MTDTILNRPLLKGAPQQSKRWAFLQKFVIPDFNDPDMPYLVRWRIIQTPWWSVYLHHIILDDGDRAVHDHPWTFWSFIVRGGYEEQWLKNKDSLPVKRTWKLFTLHKVALTNFHRILSVTPHTWSLVFTGPRRQVWGFLYPDGNWYPWYDVRSEQKAV